jgi:decaprenylphospho-beta-D-erythro-pentofuranosid-2-ulose 2-reductase
MQNAFGQPQTVVVLGGSSDIARAIVSRLAAQRARTVVLGGRDQERLDLAAEEARSAGCQRTATVLFDAEDPSGAAATVRACFESAGGPVDLVIMAVGQLANQARDERDATAAARIATVNFTWPVAALTEVRNHLVAQGAGRLLVISSVAAIRVRRSAYLYGSAKAGLDRFADAMAESLRGTGAMLQILRPGFVHSKMTAGLEEQPFAVSVDQVADAAVAGLASGRRIVTVPAVLSIVFFGLRHLPLPLWRKLVGDR